MLKVSLTALVWGKLTSWNLSETRLTEWNALKEKHLNAICRHIVRFIERKCIDFARFIMFTMLKFYRKKEAKKNRNHTLFSRKKCFNSHRETEGNLFFSLFPHPTSVYLSKLNFASHFQLKNWKAEQNLWKKSRTSTFQRICSEIRTHILVFLKCVTSIIEKTIITCISTHTATREALLFCLSLALCISFSRSFARSLARSVRKFTTFVTCVHWPFISLYSTRACQYIRFDENMCVACVGRDLCCFNF